MEKFRNKYRIQSTRLQGRDYADPGKYFVTICVKNRECVLGKIENGEMILSESGKIVQSEWLKTPEIRKNVQLDEFQIMPNHWHGIIVITHRLPTPECRDALNASLIANALQLSRDACNASLQGRLQSNGAVYKNKFGPQRNNVSSMVRGIKSSVTKLIWQTGLNDFQWQPRFHDHIIRIGTDAELNRIRAYIRNNPKNWNDDEFYS